MFQPAPLSIDPNEVLRYLGGGHAVPPEALLDEIDRCGRQLLNAVTPKVIWHAFPLSDFSLEGTRVHLSGQDIRRHLDGCTHCVLLAATLGLEAEQLIRRAQARDLSQAVSLDGCASAAIECLCDQVEDYLRKKVEEQGQFLTGRYSPGYGDLPLQLQSDLCALLDTQRRLGLTVSANHLLLPRKSVTALLGISPTPPQPPQPGCVGCRLYHSCQIRRSGRICHKEKGVSSS